MNTRWAIRSTNAVNRKQRKARLKDLNAQRKEKRKVILSSSFLAWCDRSTVDELFRRLEWLYYEHAWVDAGEKTKGRITYIEAVLEWHAKRNPEITSRLQKCKWGRLNTHE